MKPPARLDRPAVMDRSVGRFAGIDVELFEQSAKPQARALVADADADRAVFVVNAQRNHRPLEARVGHAGHRQQQLAGKETRIIHPPSKHGAAISVGKA